MKVLIDTCIWSEALRHKKKKISSITTSELIELIKEARVEIIGAIRQEILSGIKSKKQFEELREQLKEFHDVEMTTTDYEKAAENFNMLRSKGIQGSNTDFLICAVAERLGIPIYTTDNDFRKFKKYLPIQLYMPRS
jgi:predicted nucleic acid-binding protein